MHFYSFVDSPFVDENAKADSPNKYSISQMKSFKRMEDLEDHVAFLKQKMNVLGVLHRDKEIVMCRNLGSSLDDHVWFTSLV